MIKYQLTCKKKHSFDGWFRDSATYDRQEARGLLECPICGSKKVERALMAPRIGKKGGKAAVPAPAPAGEAAATMAAQVAGGAPAMPAEMRKMLLAVREQVEKNCDYVGPKFAEEARRIHYGETEKRSIYGETSDKEAAALADEGIEFGRVPWVPRGN